MKLLIREAKAKGAGRNYFLLAPFFINLALYPSAWPVLKPDIVASCTPRVHDSLSRSWRRTA